MDGLEFEVLGESFLLAFVTDELGVLFPEPLL
jgi:hypothetical protein